MSSSEERLPIHDASITTARLHLRGMRLSDAADLHEMRSDWECAKWALSPPSNSLEETQQWIEQKILSNRSRVANFSIELLDPERDARGEKRKVIGGVGAVRGAELGYALSRAYHGKGYASEAVQGLLQLFWKYIPRPQQPDPPKSQADEVPAPIPGAGSADADPREVLLGSGVGSAETPAASTETTAPPAQDKKLMDGWDFIEGTCDPQNVASAKVMVKCGFTLWQSTKDDFESVNLGLRGTAIYRLARPGTELGTPPGPFEIDMDEKMGIKKN